MNSKTILDDYNRAAVLEETSCSQKKYVNLSGIATYLIQSVGRFAEKYASDFLVGWESVKNHIKDGECKSSYIELFAIRRYGVDGELFFMERMRQWIKPASLDKYIYVEREYRQVLAVKIDVDDEGSVKVELKDLTDAFTSMADEDLR